MKLVQFVLICRISCPPSLSAERESKSKSPRPLANGTVEKPQVNGTEEKTGETDAAELDSYEARREARRKAREERMKAAAAK